MDIREQSRNILKEHFSHATLNTVTNSSDMHTQANTNSKTLKSSLNKRNDNSTVKKRVNFQLQPKKTIDYFSFISSSTLSI